MLKSLFYNSIHKFRTKNFGWKSQYEIDIKDSLLFLNNIKEPKDDIERSYNQYLCQCYLMTRSSVFLFNVGCFFLILPYIIKCLLAKTRNVNPVDIVYTISIKDKSIIPNSLHEQYQDEKITGVYEGFKLNKKDLGFILSIIKKHPFSFFFIHRIIFKISIYRYFINAYHPKAIAINSEYSSTSSVMTQYCESQGIKHINIMHGEKLLFIRDSFFRFTECYVWDEYYIGLFKKLRAAEDQFVIDKPQSLFFDKKEHKGSIPYCDYKYILFENEKLKQISDSVKKLQGKGYKVMVRPHPSYTDMEKLNKYFNQEDLEDTNIAIADSVVNSGHVISLVSTVLLQAYFSNVDIVIDDVNYQQGYNKLEELGYILIKKEHKNLSEILK